MDNTTFKTASPTPEPQVETKTDSKPQANTAPLVEKPFTLYQQENKLPLTADYFDVKLTWDEANMVQDIQAIENYMKQLVLNGEVEDSSAKVRQKMKQIEKLANIDQLESTAQRIIRLSEFVRYLQKIEGRKNDIF